MAPSGMHNWQENNLFLTNDPKAGTLGWISNGRGRRSLTQPSPPHTSRLIGDAGSLNEFSYNELTPYE